MNRYILHKVVYVELGYKKWYFCAPKPATGDGGNVAEKIKFERPSENGTAKTAPGNDPGAGDGRETSREHVPEKSTRKLQEDEEPEDRIRLCSLSQDVS